ncbi:MAG TPA: NAD(P)H-dependent oxidoreductase subunit E [Bacillota bacterium]|nr:NAD(P)H-dependent oxidoreductase subunit E [Bacillota bacterium]
MVLHPQETAEIVARYPLRRSAVLPLLWRAQERIGYVSDAAIGEVAAAAGVPASEVSSVVTFYTMFRRFAPPARRLQVCRSLACAMAGADALVARLRSLPGCGSEFAVETVECLAACDRAVAGLYNEGLVGPLSMAGAASLLRDGGGVAAPVQTGGERG